MAVFDTIDTTELLLCILGKVRIQIHRIHRQIIKKKTAIAHQVIKNAEVNFSNALRARTRKVCSVCHTF